MEKKDFISESKVKDLIKPMGSCLVSNHITLDGKLVGFMYRVAPEFEIDCGWRFVSGEETEEYMEDEDNSKVLDVNTVANYDPAIIPYLQLPVRTELERVEGSDKFQKLED
jgi:hypothetical protein